MRNVAKCPKCGTEYIEVETDFEYGGVVLRKVRATKCPGCGEEFYTPEQYGAIRQRLYSIIQPLRLTRRISAAGKRPAIYLPEDIVKAVNAKIGDEVEIYVEGKKIVIEVLKP